MKKLLCCLFCAALALCCAGCNLRNLKNLELPPLPTVTVTPAATPYTTPTPTTLPLPTTAPSPTPTPAPPVLPTSTPAPQPQAQEPLGREGQVTVNYRSTSEEYFDPENGTKRILSFAYDTPYVSITGRPQAASAIAGQLAFLDESFYSGGSSEDFPGVSGMLEMAEDNYAYARQTGQDLPLEYSLTRQARTERADSRVVSLVFTYSEYTGGAHGSYSQRGFVFDAETGALLTLSDLCADEQGFRDRLLHCMVSLTETDASLYDHVYTSYVNGDFYGTFARLLREGSWYFDETGLVIFSDLYELGPYAAGIAEFHIQYSRLEGWLDSKWFPPERTESGALRVSLMDGSEEGRLSFLDRIQTDAIGREICIAAEGTVYNLSLSRVGFSDRFYETGQLWYDSELTNAALQLVTDIPDAVPNLLLRYSDASGASYRKLITASGEDGHIILLDEAEYMQGW